MYFKQYEYFCCHASTGAAKLKYGLFSTSSSCITFCPNDAKRIIVNTAAATANAIMEGNSFPSFLPGRNVLIAMGSSINNT